jgi:hypothetical protein
MARAGTALLARLWQDARVEAAYQDCRPFLESRLLEMGAGRVDMADRTADTIRERFQRLGTQLGLTYEWLAGALYVDATARFLAEFTGLPFSKFNLGAPSVPELPQGRRPKGDGSYIARDVDWTTEPRSRCRPKRPTRSRRPRSRSKGSNRISAKWTLQSNGPRYCCRSSPWTVPPTN